MHLITEEGKLHIFKNAISTAGANASDAYAVHTVCTDTVIALADSIASATAHPSGSPNIDITKTVKVKRKQLNSSQKLASGSKSAKAGKPHHKLNMERCETTESSNDDAESQSKSDRGIDFSSSDMQPLMMIKNKNKDVELEELKSVLKETQVNS